MISRIKDNKILLLLVLLVLLTVATTLGRFIYNEIKKNFFLTQDFYFNSDKLTTLNPLYLVNNYNGVDSYDIVINLNSFKNNLVSSSEDISYAITYTCTTNANCGVSKSSGVIYEITGTDFFIFSMSPNVALNNGDYLEGQVYAETTSPYEKELSARFKLIVGNYGLSHTISDSVGSPYLELKVTNTLDYYKVLTAFGTYNIGDKLDLETYSSLSQVDKDKCASAIINLNFNPTIVLYDNVSAISNVIISSGTTNIGGNDYVNALSFKLDAISSTVVRFYKRNAQVDYTYPIVNPTSIVTVTYTL